MIRETNNNNNDNNIYNGLTFIMYISIFCLSVVLFFVIYSRIVYSFASSIICNRVPGLSPAQRQLCIEIPDAFIALGAGNMLGAQECEHQFRGMWEIKIILIEMSKKKKKKIFSKIDSIFLYFFFLFRSSMEL